jgi:hypothetical protein
MTYCCKEMETLRNPESGCNIEINEEGLLASCDDYGERFPPVRFCPWCGTKIEKGTNATTQG